MRVAALLRGVNIGPHQRVSMPALREIVAGLGHADVETYLQSGNVVFAPAGDPDGLEETLTAAIAEATGLDVGVVVRTGTELGRVAASCPYPVTDPTRVVVAFLAAELGLPELVPGDLEAYAPDELALAGRHAYVSVPNGQGRSRLMTALTRPGLPTVVTVRNWRTVTALAGLTA